MYHLFICFATRTYSWATLLLLYAYYSWTRVAQDLQVRFLCLAYFRSRLCDLGLSKVRYVLTGDLWNYHLTRTGTLNNKVIVSPKNLPCDEPSGGKNNVV